MDHKNSLIPLLLAGLVTSKGSATFRDRCGDPGVPANGRLEKINNTDAIEYVCDMEYRLIGNSKRHCQANGTWDSPTPWCEPNLYYKMADIKFGRGYEFNLRLWEKHQEKKEQFVEIDSEAIDILLPKPRTIREITLTSKGMLNTTTFFGVFVTINNQAEDPGLNCTLQNHPATNSGVAVLHFDCPSVPAEVVSIATSGPKVRLSHVGFYGDLLLEDENCGTPDSPANGSVTRKDGTFLYECNQGFQLLGKDTATCKGRQWTDQAPDCVSLSTVIEHETVSQSNTTGPTVSHGRDLAVLILVVFVTVILVVGIASVIYWKRKQLSTEKINFKSLFA